MLFVQSLFSLAQRLLLKRRLPFFKNINKVRESRYDGKPQKDERITKVGNQEVVNQLPLNTALLEGCRGNGSSVGCCDQ